MKISLEFLQSKDACNWGIKWVTDNNFLDLEDRELIQQLIKHGKLNWAAWLLVRVGPQSLCVACAVYAAEQVIDLYEKNFPDDDRPRKAIIAAKKYLEGSSYKNWVTAAHAADAAYDSAVEYSAYAAYAAANVAYAAADAVRAAEHATAAIDAAADAAGAAARATLDVTRATQVYRDLELKIIKYGLTLLEKEL